MRLRGPDYFSSGGRRWVGGGYSLGFFGFFCCSQSVPIKFSSRSPSSQCVPQYVPPHDLMATRFFLKKLFIVRLET